MLKIFQKIKAKISQLKTDKPGSALALTMFILAGMLMVAMSGSYIILLGIKAAGVQSQSTKAYFAAESGAEKFLYEYRRGIWEPTGDPSVDIPIYTNNMDLGSRYEVYFIHWPPLYINSVGSFNSTKRSVELQM